MLRFARSFVGADAHIGPLKCCEFALDFHKAGQFRRADRGVRPYGAKSKLCTTTPIRPYAGCFRFGGGMGRCGHRPLRRETGNAAIFAGRVRERKESAVQRQHPIKQKILPSQRAESRGTRVSAILRGATQVQRTRVLPFPALTGRSPVISAVVRLIHMLGGCPSRSVPQESLSKTAPSLTGTRRYCFRVIADEIFQRIERFVRSIMRQSRSPRCKPRISISAEARLVAHGTL